MGGLVAIPDIFGRGRQSSPILLPCSEPMRPASGPMARPAQLESFSFARLGRRLSLKPPQSACLYTHQVSPVSPHSYRGGIPDQHEHLTLPTQTPKEDPFDGLRKSKCSVTDRLCRSLTACSAWLAAGVLRGVLRVVFQ